MDQAAVNKQFVLGRAARLPIFHAQMYVRTLGATPEQEAVALLEVHGIKPMTVEQQTIHEAECVVLRSLIARIEAL